jgi:hypothetical protein
VKKQILAYVNEDASGWRVQNKELFLNFLKDFGAGTKLKLTLEKYHPQRSLKQNNALHLWLDLIAEDCGLPMAKMKEILAFKFLQRPALDKDGEMMVDMETGEVQMYIPSTADLDKKEMARFMDEIWLWTLYNRGFELPKFDENYKINFQEERKEKIKYGK